MYITNSRLIHQQQILRLYSNSEFAATWGVEQLDYLLATHMAHPELNNRLKSRRFALESPCVGNLLDAGISNLCVNKGCLTTVIGESFWA